MQFSTLALLSLPLGMAVAGPIEMRQSGSGSTVYLIRHGEKPADGGDGLSPQGEQRAQCLRGVFGASSQYNIGYIIAEQPKSDGSRERPLETVQPLAKDLGLTVDTSCDRDDSSCVANLVDNYSGSGNILICWEHGQLTDIVHSLGAKKSDSPTYPGADFNLIWTDPSPYTQIVSQTSENCPGLDNNSTSSSTASGSSATSF